MNPEQVVSVLTGDSRVTISHIVRHEVLVSNGRGPYVITEKIHQLESTIKSFVDKHWRFLYQTHISSGRYGFSGKAGDIIISGYRLGEVLLLEMKYDDDFLHVTGKATDDISLYNIDCSLNDAIMIVRSAASNELSDYAEDDSVTLI